MICRYLQTMEIATTRVPSVHCLPERGAVRAMNRTRLQITARSRAACVVCTTMSQTVLVLHNTHNVSVLTKATVTPDRMISGSYDWLQLGQGATDRQCLLRSPAAVTYRYRSLRVVALSQTIGEYRWQEP